jgi:hypothetical protein
MDLQNEANKIILKVADVINTQEQILNDLRQDLLNYQVFLQNEIDSLEELKNDNN